MTSASSVAARNASGLAWVDTVPAHWRVVPAWSVVKSVRRPPLATDGTVTAFRDGEVTLRSNRRTDGFTEAVQEHGYQGVRAGELVIHSMDGFAGAIGVSDSDGKMSPVVHIYSVPNDEPRFVALLVRELAKNGVIESLAKGIRERSTSFDRASFKSLALPLPPVEEQKAILRFLDRETAQIDAFIAKNEELITLLTERRAAIITHLSTRGLDEACGTRDSGIPWVGRVPGHWKVLKLRHVLAEPITDGPHVTPEFIDEGVEFLSVDGIVDGELHFPGTRFISHEDHREFSRKASPRRGDLLMGKAASVGKIARVKTDREFSIWSPLALLRHGPAITAEYMELCLKSGHAQAQFAVFANYNTQANIAMGDIGEVVITLPPLEEQRAIAGVVESKLAAIDRARDVACRAVDLARERRAALISAAVTGKISVGVDV